MKIEIKVKTENATTKVGFSEGFLEAAEWILKKLNDEQRASLMAGCCKSCGGLDAGCQCWNDD